MCAPEDGANTKEEEKKSFLEAPKVSLINRPYLKIINLCLQTMKLYNWQHKSCSDLCKDSGPHAVVTNCLTLSFKISLRKVVY